MILDTWEFEKKLIATLTENDAALYEAAVRALDNNPDCTCAEGDLWRCWFDLSPKEKAAWAVECAIAVRGES